jgi:hypothetical protein
MAKAEKVFAPLSDEAFNDMADEADELKRLLKAAEEKYRPFADHIKAEMQRREIDAYTTPAGTPLRLDFIEKEFASLDEMRKRLPQQLYNECVTKKTQINLTVGHRSR